jgi:AcrR family transcriptional regulator
VTDAVKKRAYHSPKREERAAQTRSRIIAAASEKFLADGFVQTSTASIAKAAGTSEANLFAVFGSKTDLLFQVILHHIRDAPDLPTRDLMFWEGLIGAEHRAPAVARWAGVVRRIMESSWEIRAVGIAAAAVDDAAQKMLARGARGRYEGALWFAEEVLQLPERDRAATADAFWTLMSVDNYRALVVDRGWSPDRYESWLATVLRASLPA